MSTLPLTAALKDEYEKLWASIKILSARLSAVRASAARILARKARYQAVEQLTGVPWVFVGLAHAMEAGLRFDRHLHNGDPLTARTLHVPAGRPLKGEPPFTWEESAADALHVRGLSAETDWSLPGLAFQLEAYNGFGYRIHHPQTLSPYLWSFTRHYKAGKYVADGAFSAQAISQQSGAMALLYGLCEKDAELAARYRPDLAPADLWHRLTHWLRYG